MSYVLSHLSYILSLPSPTPFKEKGKRFYVTNAFCWYKSIYPRLYAANCLSALMLLGFVNVVLLYQIPSAAAPLPGQRRPPDTAFLLGTSWNPRRFHRIVCIESFQFSFAFTFPMLTYFFPQGLDGTATNPKPSAPRAHSHQCHLWSPKRHPRPFKSGMSHGLQATAGTRYHKGAPVVFLRDSFSSFSTEKSYKTEAAGCPLAKGAAPAVPRSRHRTGCEGL